jgi:hypothetical protein
VASGGAIVTIATLARKSNKSINCFPSAYT